MYKLLLIPYFIFKGILILRIYQQSHYQIKPYLKYMLRNFLYLDLVPLIIAIVSLILTKVQILSYILIDIYGLFYLKRKVRLCITNRIKRLIGILVILIILIIYPPILILFEYIAILVLLLMSKLEEMISNHYIRECKLKLNNYKGIKIAITGSYGKTTTKHILYELLKNIYPTLVMPKSYNTPLGIAKIINSNNINKYNIIIFEMGATKTGDIEYLMKLINPNITIITEVGNMHLDSFKNINNILNEKCKASDMVKGISIVNIENEYLRNYNYKNKIIGYGIHYGLYRIKEIDDNSFELYFNNEYYDTYHSNIKGKFNYLNMTACIIAMIILGIDSNKIKEGLNKISNYNSRLEIKEYNNLTIINDGFNSNLTGAIEALRVLNTYKKYKILITPLFVEMKIDSTSYYDEMIDKCNLVLLIGYHETKDAYKYLVGNVNVYIINSFKEAMKIVNKIAKRKPIALLIENDLPDIYRKGF
ncbi:MAG: Mur ligase family protein [Anaeroplasmataceae bacterium]